MHPSTLTRRLVRHLPPPRLVGLPLRAAPLSVQRPIIEGLLNRLFARQMADGDFDYLDDRVLAVEIHDLDVRWTFTLRAGRLCLDERDATADATIRGRAAEFLMLTGRVEDPDTLFFQRRLEVTGDTTVGLTTRNLLDRLCWEDLPLALRIVLNRAGRLGQRIRAACGIGRTGDSASKGPRPANASRAQSLVAQSACVLRPTDAAG